MFNVMDVKAPFLLVKETYSGWLNCAEVARYFEYKGKSKLNSFFKD